MFKRFFDRKYILAASASVAALSSLSYHGGVNETYQSILHYIDLPSSSSSLPSSLIPSLPPPLHYSAACLDAPRSREFIADAVDKALPGVVTIEMHRQWGTGFIIDEKGYIVTNEHVVSNGQRKVVVVLNSGNRLVGEVIALDKLTDLALIKVDKAAALPVVKMGSDKSLRAGQLVAAIGNNFGFHNTVTMGVISCTSRRLSQDIETTGVAKRSKVFRTPYIQTDATINNGNSGGPLINMDGEAIGVNTLSVENGGIAFSIPISEVKRFLADYSKRPNQEEEKKPNARYSLGVQVVSLTPEMVTHLHHARRLSVDVMEGIFVYRTVPGSPAALAGLRHADVIYKINDLAVQDRQSLEEALAGGDEVKLKIYRPGRGTMLMDITPTATKKLSGNS